MTKTAALLAVEAMQRSPGVERPSWLQHLIGLLPEELRTIPAQHRTASLDTDTAMRRMLTLLPERSAEMDCAVSGDMREAAFSPDGRYLAQVMPSQYMTRPMDRRLREDLLFEERHWALAFSLDSRYPALDSPEWDARVYDLETYNRVGEIWKPGTGGQLVKPDGDNPRFDTIGRVVGTLGCRLAVVLDVEPHGGNNHC